MPAKVTARLLRAVTLLGHDVPADIYAAQAADIAKRCSFAPLLVMLARARSAGAEAIMPHARLSEADWLGALPHLDPISRSLLRRRTDLPEAVVRGLYLFAASDMTLAAPTSDEGAGDRPSTDIRDLVRRIEEYRQRRAEQANASEDVIVDPPAIHFGFATDATARIVDAEVRERGRFIGIELGQPAAALESGCDAGTARIVGKRGRITAGRLLLTGDDQWAGTWLCDAEPRFAHHDGAFRGYTGTLRRPHPHEVVEPLSDRASDAPARGFAPELLRQLMHELRSPLNAVAGFAQLIEGQYAGPVAAQYRAAASTILDEAERLGAVVDEIDLMAQLSGVDSSSAAGEPTRLAAVLKGVQAMCASARRPIHIVFEPAPLPEDWIVAGPAEVLERLLRLWLQPLASPPGADAPARLLLTVRRDGDEVVVTLTQPVEPALSLPKPENEQLGFAIAAAMECARDLGGSLQREGDQYILNLPLVSSYPCAEEQVG